MRSRAGTAFVVLAAVLACGVILSAQAPPRTVWVPVTVTDAYGHLVTSLRRDDFAILAGDEPRPVTVFSQNEMPAAVSLMLDISRSMRKQVTPTRRAARLLIDQFVRGDRVNIGAFDGAVLISDRFIANRARIQWSLDQPLTGADTPCVAPNDKRQLGSRAEAMPGAIGGGGTAMFDAIWCGVRELQRDTESIRKVIVLITDGRENTSRGKEDTAIGLIQSVGALVYSVGFLGLEGGQLNRNDTLLRKLAAATGGLYFPLEDEDPVGPVFQRIGEELRAQYVLGFEPKTAGSTGNLQVLVKTPGLTARARPRY